MPALALLCNLMAACGGGGSSPAEGPYPLEMRHGVFSVTKSAPATLTMLRLAENFGEQVFDLFGPTT